MEARKSKRVEQGEQTRAHLVSVGRTLFAQKGFAATSTEDIVQAAQITRGALYHHFDGKEQLFEAVFEQLEAEMIGEISRYALKARSPSERVRRAISSFLEQCLDPAVQRVILRDGLSILGWQRWYEIDAKYALGSLIAVLDEAVAAGEIVKQPAEPLAHALLGAMSHAGMYIAGAADADAARKEMDRTLRRLFDGLVPK